MKRLQTQKEYWKIIDTFYYVSNLGRVKSQDHYRIGRHGKEKVKTKGRILKPVHYNNGYYYINLHTNRKPIAVHRLVAIAFLKNHQNKPCVNHLNGDRSDNRKNNLSWCTYSENEKWSYRKLGKKPNKTGTGKIGLLNGSSKPVALLNNDLTIRNVFENATMAERSIKGTDRTKINSVCGGFQKSHRGLLFRRISIGVYKRYSMKPVSELATEIFGSEK